MRSAAIEFVLTSLVAGPELIVILSAFISFPLDILSSEPSTDKSTDDLVDILSGDIEGLFGDRTLKLCDGDCCKLCDGLIDDECGTIDITDEEADDVGG